MKIPQFEPSVSVQEGRALEIPNVTTPPPVAFGTEGAQRIEQLGSTVSGLGEKLATHMLEREHQQQTAQVIQSDTQFKTDLQKTMFDTEVNENNVPKGVFNRMGYQAQGATAEFDADFKAKRQAALDAMDTPYKKQRLGELMDENYPRLREHVAQHEGTQVRIGKTSVVDGHNELATQNAPIYFNDPRGLIKSIGTEAQMRHDNMRANGVDDDKIVAKINDLSGKMVLSSLRPSLHENPEAAQNFFDKINEDPANPLDPTQQGKIQDIIDDAKKRFTSHQKTLYDVHANGQEAELAGKIANGKLTLDELEASKPDDAFYKIATIALKNPPAAPADDKEGAKQDNKFTILMKKYSDIQAEKDPNKQTSDFMKFRRDILAESRELSPDAYSKLLGWTDPNFIKEITPEKMSHLQAGISYIRDNYKDFLPGHSPVQALGALFQAVRNPGVKPSDIPAIARQAVQGDTLKENPSLIGQPDLSNNVIDQKSGIKQVTRDTTTLKPDQKIMSPPTFKAGDVQEKNGVKYQRSEDGKWRPMKS